jgi:hypothetical protein
MKVKKFAFYLILLCVIFTFFGCQQREGVGESPNATHLFNGTNLDNFYVFLKGLGRDNDPNKVFTVEDGLLHISGQDWGCVTTDSEFENYRLIVEFKWGEKTWGRRIDRARDSGVMLHSIGEDGGHAGVWMRSIEMQMIEGGTGDLLVVGDKTLNFSATSPVADEKQGRSWLYKPGGKLVTINNGRINWQYRDPDWQDAKNFRGSGDIEKPLGEWNRYEAVSCNGTLKYYLNGQLVNEAYNVKPSKGKIQIQSEGAELFIRKIDIILLGKNCLK